MVSAIVLIGGIIALIEAPALIRRKMTRELWIFAVVLAFAIAISILHALRIPLPNPLDWITAAYKPVSDFIFGTVG
jgi:hypothetical protein